jgi:alkylation response protein AidB-like acyl-CoA dehydrogenase
LIALACDHVTHRQQFGRPIGSFQAVKHRLADATVAVVAAESALDEAWATDDDFSAMLAKALAGRAVRSAAKESQQVLGAMGFTWDHPLHRYIRRSMVLDAILGSAPALAVTVGDELLARREAPRVGVV